MARLDRFYSFASVGPNPSAHISKNDILGDCGLSDHLPIRFEIHLQAISSNGSHFKMNGAYLSDPSVIEKLHQVWLSAPPNLEFFGKMHRVVKWYKSFCKEKAAARRAKETRLKSELKRAQEIMQDQCSRRDTANTGKTRQPGGYGQLGRQISRPWLQQHHRESRVKGPTQRLRPHCSP